MEDQSGFISVDWGTSRLRVSFCQRTDGKIIQSISTEEGCWAVNQAWQKSKRDRLGFYVAVLDAAVKRLQETLGNVYGEIAKLPMVISGMASSSLGIAELPYAQGPFALDGRSLEWKALAPNRYLLSGLQCGTSLMRGEEVQLIGWAVNQPPKNAHLILPGTHSKHVQVGNGQVISFQTFMTGELFAVLGEHSVLKQTITEPNELDNSAFFAGIDKAVQSGMLTSLFSVRSEVLLGLRNRTESYSFLSGLLIGAECMTISSETVHLLGTGSLLDAYAIAIEHLYPAVTVLRAENNLVSKGHAVFLGLV